jgi:hypothetical protein
MVLANIGLHGGVGPVDFPQMTDVAVDREVLLFALVLSGVAAVACGVAPAWFRAEPHACRASDVAEQVGNRDSACVRGSAGGGCDGPADRDVHDGASLTRRKVSPGFAPDQGCDNSRIAARDMDGGRRWPFCDTP